MEKILFMGKHVDGESSHLDQVVEIATNRGAELSALFVIPVSMETADWINVQEKQIKEAEEKARAYGRRVEEYLQAGGIPFNWQVVHLVPSAFMAALEELTPVDIIIAGDIDLEPLAEKGIKHLEDISALLNCPVLPLSSLVPDEKKANGRVLTRLLLFGALSAVSYFFFFPLIDKLNHAIYMKGTFLGALAVMLTVPFHAYIYGSFTECFPKLMGLEKSAGTNH